MSDSDPIVRAAAAIGESATDDYILRPQTHAEQLKEAPALARLLKSSMLQEIARRYDRFDEAAVEAQRRFKQAAAQANSSLLLATGLSAGLLAVGVLAGTLGNAPSTALFIFFGLASIIVGALATMWLFRIREGGLLEEWMGARAHAETSRLNYFATLIGQGNRDPSDPPLILLKLEYFRRYQLDMQIAYYSSRLRDHRVSADKTLRLGAVAAATASAASGAAGFLGALGKAWASLAALGVVASAIGAFASTREGVNQDRRNAERYGRTLSALEILRGKLDEVRAGVLVGSEDVLREYVAAVHDQLSLEHRQWLAGQETTRSAIARLEESLAKAQRDEAPSLPGGPIT